jgi:hypothetical protein
MFSSQELFEVEAIDITAGFAATLHFVASHLKGPLHVLNSSARCKDSRCQIFFCFHSDLTDRTFEVTTKEEVPA